MDKINKEESTYAWVYEEKEEEQRIWSLMWDEARKSWEELGVEICWSKTTQCKYYISKNHYSGKCIVRNVNGYENVGIPHFATKESAVAFVINHLKTELE